MPRVNRSALDALLSDAVVAGAVPGIAMVVATSDEVAYEGYAGRLRADEPDSPRVDPGTLFRLASMTKAPASVAVLQLVEEGRLGLGTVVEDVLPEFAELGVLDGWDGDIPRLRAPSRPSTIQDLLTHTSGLGYFFSSAELVRWQDRTGTPSVLTGRRESLRMPLLHDPGTRFEYGISTDWLGLVIEALAGAELDAVLADRVFGPLGLTDTTFRPSEEQRARLMAVHTRAADGGLDISPLDLPADPEFLSAGGGAYATARDHGRFLRALLRGGELDGTRVLGEASTELMFTDHLGGLPQPEITRSAVPELTNDVPSLPIRQGFGLGLHVRHEGIEGMRPAGSADWAGLFNSYFWIDRDSDLAVTVFTQMLPFFDHGVVGTLIALEQELYASEPPA